MGVNTLTTLYKRWWASVRVPDFTKQAAANQDDLEWNAVQLEVAKDAAISAAIDVIKWQTEAWNELVSGVNELGVDVSLNPEQQAVLNHHIVRLKAAITVANEVLNLDLENLKGFSNER